ncbi:MAG: phosphonate degradation associated HDIG domain protein [Polaromonas sp.]|jgi:phosphonate degradation associated HDIG domain protein
MAVTLSSAEIIHLFETRATSQYGREAVSQLEHALQCAQLAEQAGETDATVVAALLHDLGHLIAAKKEDRPDDTQQRDDLHQYIAIPFLRGLLPDSVLEPIRLHVDAKRYLCAAVPTYWASLSPASKRSLELQGGAYSEAELAIFLAQPYAEEAVRLRRYDDLAKVPKATTPGLAHFQKKLEALVKQG